MFSIFMHLWLFCPNYTFYNMLYFILLKDAHCLKFTFFVLIFDRKIKSKEIFSNGMSIYLSKFVTRYWVFNCQLTPGQGIRPSESNFPQILHVFCLTLWAIIFLLKNCKEFQSIVYKTIKIQVIKFFVVVM
mgnify:CR=1 FL=1